MSRYPYTYAADFIRSHAGSTPVQILPDDLEFAVPVDLFSSPKLSRGEAAHLSSKIAEALGMDKEIFCQLLAKQYLHDSGIKEETPPAPSLEDEGHVPNNRGESDGD
jgi:hypothetical protein